MRAQEFTGGDENATLGGVEIKFSSGSDDVDAPTVTLRRRDGQSYVLIAELTGPKKLAGGDNEFAAPANTTLEAGTVYAVRLEGGGSGVAVRGTTDDSETGESGWSVGNDSLHRSSGTTSYETNSNALMIRVIEAGERFDPFEPPLAPSLSVSETTSTDGSWTVSWGGPNHDELYYYVELEETSARRHRLDDDVLRCPWQHVHLRQDGGGRLQVPGEGMQQSLQRLVGQPHSDIRAEQPAGWWAPSPT